MIEPIINSAIIRQRSDFISPACHRRDRPIVLVEKPHTPRRPLYG
jgi:hypothetical protein